MVDQGIPQEREAGSADQEPSIAIFAPHPLLTVAIEFEGEDDDSVHFHAGGQGVWVAAMARCLGAQPILCALLGGEPGELLRPLLRATTGLAGHFVATASPSGCYVVDRRRGERELVAIAINGSPSRHEVDELCSLAVAHAMTSGWLVVTNPMPAEALPIALYREIVADARAGGARVLVDLSSPRLDSALQGRPDLVKINDWELAEYICGSVSQPGELLAAARRMRESGAERVIVTRGADSALVLDGDRALELTPPYFEHGFREGCGDAMFGALAATWAATDDLDAALIKGAAAGAANFLRRGIGHASRETIEELAKAVELTPWPAE